MKNVYEMTRDLGNAILESEEGKRMNEARKKYYASEEAVNKTNEYVKMQEEATQKQRNGELSPEEAQIISKKLSDFYMELKANELINELLEAEDDFSEFTNRVMTILRATVTGEDPNNCQGCAGSCDGGCSCG